MDYEKKLREIINSNSEYYPSEDKVVFAKYFPELKEPEDERIRKEIIDFVKSRGWFKGDWLAWLEKQGEDKHTNKVEPKFKVGDWVLNDVCYPMQIASIKDSMYIFTEGDAMSVSFVDEHLHLWSIQDGEDGNVLINWNNTTFIFKAIEDETIQFHIAYNENWDTIKTPSTKLSHLGLPEPQFEFHPATKEQCDLLFSKMKEAGYEWDSEKKELKKIEIVSKESEDEKIRKGLINGFKECLKNCQYPKDVVKYWHNVEVDSILAWLEKQGEKKDYTFKPIPRLLNMIVPSEKAKSYCQKLIDTLIKEGYDTDAKIAANYLKQMNGEEVAMATMNENEKQGEKKPTEDVKKLDADKVIEWLKNTIGETKEYFGVYGVCCNNTHLTLPYNSIEDLINDFKEDFGL